MSWARLKNNLVIEILPIDALPVSEWYGPEFASQCMEIPDNVKPNWVYDPSTNSFSEPIIPDPDPTNKELANENKLLKAQLQAQTERSDFMEECVAEMATKVYATV